jgi:hypothetical protein
VLGHYVRETGALGWEEAIRKMSGLPASIVGLVDRGLIAPGMLADVVVFDPKTVLDYATYEHPTLPSKGIREVLVNGEAVMRDTRLTGKQPGRVLARKANMPTRRTSAAQALSISVTSAASGGARDIRLNLGVSQRAGEYAQGRLKFSDSAENFSIETVDFGFAQTLAQWSSLTGVAKTRLGERRFTLTFDRADPLDPQHRSTLSLDIPGVYALDRAVMPAL